MADWLGGGEMVYFLDRWLAGWLTGWAGERWGEGGGKLKGSGFILSLVGVSLLADCGLRWVGGGACLHETILETASLADKLTGWGGVGGVGEGDSP